jgi:hypothetical protein
MPRLSLYKPERGQDYTFIDRQISEMFQVGGTDVYLHKYVGTNDGTTVKDHTQIQDLLFLENRDRKYDQEIYRIRGLYNVQNIDFNLSQFGLFIDNDTLYMTVHINDFIKYIGRKPLSGDVLELPHLSDQFALSDADISLPRYYVIEDVGRASEGFSATWYPHLYRLKLKKITNSQQFADVLNKPSGADADKFVGDFVAGTVYYPGQIVRFEGQLYQVDDAVPNTGTTVAAPDASVWNVYGGLTIEGLLSTRAKELAINDAILTEAEANAPKSGYETGQFFTLAVDPTTGKPVLNTADTSSLDASVTSITALESNARPTKTGYTGYLVGDGIPSNGYDFGHGIQFPELAGPNDFFLRTDFMPNRLFRFDGTRWIRVEDDVRMTMTNPDPTRPISDTNPNRQTLKTSFINNTAYIFDQAVAIDYVNLTAGNTVINATDVNFITALYVVLKLDSTEIAFTVADHAGMLSNNAGKLRITLPIINGVQQVIPETGTWKLSMCNGREAQRQSLSKALRPKEDL